MIIVSDHSACDATSAGGALVLTDICQQRINVSVVDWVGRAIIRLDFGVCDHYTLSSKRI